MTELCQLEREARRVIEAARAKQECWSPPRQCVLNVFKAQWARALTAKRVALIAEAVEGFEPGSLDLQKEMTALVREGVLRSRRERGFKLYELNLSGEG